MTRFIYSLPALAAFLLAALFFFSPGKALVTDTQTHSPNTSEEQIKPLTKVPPILLSLDGKKEIWAGRRNDHSHYLFNFKSASLFTSRGHLIQDLQTIEGTLEMLSNSGKAQICYLEAPSGRCDIESMHMQLPKAILSIFESPLKGSLPEAISTHLVAEGESKNLTFSLDKGLNLKTSRIQANLFSEP